MMISSVLTSQIFKYHQATEAKGASCKMCSLAQNNN